MLVALAVYAAKGAGFMRQSAAGRIGTGFLLGMLGLAFAWLAQLPFGAAGQWWARRHGLSHQGYGAWLVSEVLGLAGEFLAICLGLLIVMALAGVLRRRWWLAGAPAFVGLAAALAWAQPYLLPSLSPLAPGPLAADARSLARQEGLPPIPVRVENVHRLTGQPNAEAAGLGASRRVILWDTLLDGRFSRREVRVVLAHELGHLSRDHVAKDIGWLALLLIPGAFLAELATRRRGGLHQPAAVPLALLVAAVLSLIVSPLRAAASRRYEAEADWVALRTTRDPAAAKALFEGFTAVSREDPDPPAWSQRLSGSHPTLLQRVEMAVAWQRRCGSGATAAGCR